MKIKITGGTGFVGGHITKYLHDLGYDIDLINKNEFLRQQWSLLEDGTTDVVHCAWPTDKDLHSVEHIEFAEWSCNFFNECKKRGIRVINIGSSSEYGVKYEPMREDMICEPINAYGIAKLSVTLYAKLLGYNTLRLFTVTGEGGHSFADICDKVGKWGYPENTRDFVPIQFLTRGIEQLLHAKYLYGEIINVCTGGDRTYWDVADHTLVKGNTKWLGYPQTQYEPSVWIGDNTKMKRLLNI